ncbi:MAG: alanine racemase C-terminal domain-containing protein [Treponema socranskii subsp. buccale]
MFGPENSGALQTAADIAKASGTISYEILTGIAKRVPRVEV